MSDVPEPSPAPVLAQVGDFCPNPLCPQYGQLGQGNIIRFGKTSGARQRFRCHACMKTFTETKGTLFYGRRKPQAQILHALALIAEGSRPSSIVRTLSITHDTLRDWVELAAGHVEVIEAALLADYHVDAAQIDALWTYVGNRGQKKAIPRPMSAAPSGAQP